MNRKTFGVAVLCSFVFVAPILSSCAEAPEIVNLEYTLIFHSFTEPEIEPVTVDYLNLLCLVLPVPEKEGYTFTGWYLDESFTNEYRVDVLSHGENNLYAKYEINQYQIVVHTEPEQIFTFNYGEDIYISIKADSDDKIDPYGSCDIIYIYPSEQCQCHCAECITQQDNPVYSGCLG